MASKTQSDAMPHAMPAAMPAAGQADDGARKTQCDTQSDANRAGREVTRAEALEIARGIMERAERERLPDYDVTNWLGDDGQIHWSED